MEIHSNDLLRAIEETRHILLCIEERRDEVSNDIKELEKYLISLGVNNISMRIRDPEIDGHLKMENNRIIFEKLFSDGSIDYSRPLIEHKIQTRFIISKYLPGFLRMIAEKYKNSYNIEIL